MEKVFVILINSLLYALCIGGLVLVMRQDIKRIYGIVKTRRRLNYRLKTERSKNKLTVHADMLTAVVLKEKITGQQLLLIISMLFILTFTVALRQFNPVFSILLGAAVALLPVGVLELRLSGIRSRGSQEGESFVACFLAKYRLKEFNVYEAMAATVSEENNSRICSQLLYKALLELRATGDKAKIRSCTEGFAESIKTNWSKVFAYNIYIAAAFGINISTSVEEILIQLRDARALAEERKRLNGEAVRIVVFLVPVAYIITTLLSLSYMDMTLEELVRNQFFTGTGLLLIAAIVIMFVMNVALLELINNHKFDY